MKHQFFNVKEGKDNTARLLLYGEIGRWCDDVKADRVAQELRALEERYDRIDVHINCMGGEVFSGLAIFNALRNSTADIHIYIDGIAASMGSVIAAARRPLHMSKYSRLMLHSPSAGAYGNKQQLGAVIVELESIEDTLADIYAERTGKSKEDIVRTYFDGSDHWLTAQQALDLKLIDDIFDAEPVPEKATAEQVYNFYLTHNNLNNSTMDTFIDLLRKKPAFASLTDEAALARIEQLEREADCATALATEIDVLKGEVKAFKDAQAAAREADITALVDAAVKDGRIKEPQRGTFTNLLKASYDDGKAALEALHPAARVADDLAAPAGDGDKSIWEARMEEIQNKSKK